MALVGLLLWGVLILLLIIFVFASYIFRKRARYFEKNGIPYLGAGLQRSIQFLKGSLNLILLEMDIYKEASKKNAPLVGVSDMFGQTSLYITDLDLIRNIYVKDFDHFVNRRPVGTQKTNKYFRKMLFSMESEQWKGIRAKLSPSFTTGKIRRMFEIFRKSSERMDIYVKEQMKSNTKSVDLDFTQIFPKYSMDVIASCSFGIDSKSWEVPPNQRSTFEQMGKQFQFQFNTKTIIKFILFVAAPKLTDLLGIDAMDYESGTYFSNVITDVMKRRRQTGERREDFLQLMMDAQQGLLKADEETNQVMTGSNGADEAKMAIDPSNQGKVTFDDDDLVANGMLFLLGGFDPTQAVLVFTVYCLALNPEVQEKVYNEVKDLKDKNGGQLTYDSILEMNYLDLVINETMRLYPPAARTERSCTKAYTVPGTNFVIEKGTIVSIPIHPFHHDARYFPNPEKFIPERFTPENKAARHPYAFMPFGHGPRNCIGNRFALIVVKTAVAQLVDSYQLAPCSKTTIPIEFGNNANISPKNGMWISLTSRS